MQGKPTKNYIEQHDFFRETLISLNRGEATDAIAVMFMKLCDKYANHQNFVRYHHIRDDLISIGVMACLKGLPKFRPYRNDLTRAENGEILTSTRVEWDGEMVEYDYKTCNNPFAFFTKCAHNDIIQFLKAEYNFKNILNKTRLLHGLEADAGYVDMMKERDEADLAARDAIQSDFLDEDDEQDSIGIVWEGDDDE